MRVMMNILYADIIIDISIESLDRTFQYKIPDNLIKSVTVGTRVRVPFGNGNREIIGFVLNISNDPKIDADRIKEIKDIVIDEMLVEQKLLSLAHWIKEHYGSTMNHALKVVFPLKKRVKKSEHKTVRLLLDANDANEKLELFRRKHQVARFRLLNELINEQELDYKLVTGKLNISSPTIKALEEQNVIEVTAKRVYRRSVKDISLRERINLNDSQKKIVDDFVEQYRNGDRNTYLLRGITGSGKTEVYMEMIDYVVANGKSAIVLIPEISLTYQTVMRFYKRFGERVSTMHSRLSDGERFDQFEMARKHEIDIMIGPRSALFTPFDNLGLIIIDEEHEHTYKSDKMPKYHAKEVAIELARLHGAAVVLGSATPDIASYYEAKNGQYKLYELDKRAKIGSQLPRVSIVDLKAELAAGNKSIFSRKLHDEISDRLLKGEQTMLFLNRRGYAGFVSCRSCGEAVKCPHCDVSLTMHKGDKLICHYCGYEQSMIKLCPKCGSHYIGGMRAGTQTVEEQLKKLFPQANVLRMDRDTTGKKDDYDNILAAFANREADILVGTQMIVKGHDFPNVTLVGILAADMSLNGNDYKAAERTYQLIVQAAGRAGRGEKSGEVIIQTYQDDNYAIKLAATQDYNKFYEEEIAYRQLMHYPPAGHMLAILVEAEQELLGNKYSASLAEYIKNDIIKGVIVIGPAPATVKKISDIYRYVIYIKSNGMQELITIKDMIEMVDAQKPVKGIRLQFDFDPVNGY